MLFAKTAIILEWMRIFVPKGTRNFFFWTCLSILSVNAAFYVVAIFIINLTCRPVQKSWYLMTPGVCFGAETRRHFDFSSACINLALDILILFLPQRTIWTLNMPSKKKIGVSLVFTIGLGACAAALGRVITGRTLFGSQDRTYDAAAPTLCVLAEMTCTFLVFSSPAILKVFTKTRATMQIAETLRSWSRIFSRNRSVGSNTSGQNAGMEPGAYRKMHENSELPLARLSRPAEGGAKPWAGGAIHGGRQRDHDDEILRSTTLSADGHELAS
ncbi:hypothetical protein BKA67DRAFT_111379 [Truncatella angustata]|uniref:Rhodopsin domain-containing protein n=1 Tax=Truncatella angustata TaxID=152316 RepID=A0A9P8RG57_9PEZI|nr:uncharacterized protein BKA67DRAFT_111379 [Truncatella angustata]KAH6645398.1 hypothetical protein BKA67DRAFT_111379 [Truncatella angustata]